MKHLPYILCVVFGSLLLLSFYSCNKDDEGQDETPDVTDPVENFTGEIEWIKTFGGSNEDSALSIVETADGGYAVTGYTQSIDGDIIDKTAPDSDYFVMKLSNEGSISWIKTYGGTGDDRAEKIIQTSDGGFVLAGYSRSDDEDVTTNEGLQDYWIVKLNTTGVIEWEKSFGFPGIDRAFSVLQSKDGGYFVTGFLDVTASEGGGNDDAAKSTGAKHGVGEFWGIKLDAAGNREWRRYFGGTDNDRSYDVVQTNDEGFLMIGSSESTDFDITDSKGSYDFWAVKVDAKGTLQWQKSYGGSEIDVAYAIAPTDDGKFIIIGDARSNDVDITNARGNADLWMIQIDGTGNLQWQKSLGGSQFDTGRGISKMKNGNFIITGNSRSSDGDLTTNRGQSDLWNLIIDPNGTVQWKTTTGGSGSEFGEGCLETMDKKIVVAGYSDSNDYDISENKGSRDILVVKYK